MALDGGAAGLRFYRVLARECPELLKDDGVLMAEFGDGEFGGIEEIFRSAGWKSIRPEKDYSNKERFSVAQHR
jgi:release factor glutamine methyltransferase